MSSTQTLQALYTLSSSDFHDITSGSNGNCALVSSSATRLLVDAGLSCREIMRRMKLCGEDGRAIDAILITHEHGDHAEKCFKLPNPFYFIGPPLPDAGLKCLSH